MEYTITVAKLKENMRVAHRKQLIEKNVLVIPGTQAPAMPIDNQPSQSTDWGNITPKNDSASIDARTNGPKFDAGVEADPDEDPKRYIQQLTGKLSTELQKYINEGNDENGELSKYVLGMLVKQAGKSLGESDKKEIIKKLNTTAQSDTTPESTEKEEEEPENQPENGDGDTVQENLMMSMSNKGDKDREDKVSRSMITRSTRPYKTKF